MTKDFKFLLANAMVRVLSRGGGGGGGFLRKTFKLPPTMLHAVVILKKVNFVHLVI